jgi:hypothetical protein
VFLGHYAAALAGKSAAPKASLGTYILAGQFIDLVWPVLLLTGTERVRIRENPAPFMALDFVSYPVSHSLVTVLGWATLFGAGYFALRRDARTAAILGLIVLSHWFLDLVVHVPDLPLAPGDSQKVGLGLWRVPPAAIALEFTLLILGTVLYVRSTRAKDRAGSIGLWTGLALLAFVYLGSMGPPPPNVPTLAYSALSLWLLVVWGYWVDRHREPVATPPA